MTGYEMRNETIDYLKKMLEKRKNELVLKMPEIYIEDIQEAYSDGLKSGLQHHSYDYLVKTTDLKKRCEKQKEIIKKLIEAIHKWDYKNLEEVEAEAEQFLEGESTTSNECHDCAKFDEMPKGPRCKTCDNGSHFQKKEEA